MGNYGLKGTATMGASRKERIPVVNASTTYKFQPFVWKECCPATQVKPKGRSGHRMVSNNFELYSYGGYNPNVPSKDPDMADDKQWHLSKPLFRELWRFSVTQSSWNKVTAVDVPLVLASNAIILQGKLLLVYGGTGMPFGGHCSNTVYVADLSEATPTFREVEVTGTPPQPQYGQAAFIHQHNLYVIGGTTGFEYSSDVHRLDLKTSEWFDDYVCKGLPNEPLGRYRHELAVHGNRVYIFGGGTCVDSFGFEKIPVYDFVKMEWTIVKTFGEITESGESFPKPRRFHSCARIPDSVFLVIIGGLNKVSEILDDCWMFDLQNLQWKLLDCLRMPYPVYFHASSIAPSGKLFNYGGIRDYVVPWGREEERTSTIHSTWVCIPRLVEMCWEAFLHYNFHKSPEMADELPPLFKERLENDY